MTAGGNLPDWGQIAEKFDLWLPHLEPVGHTMLNALAVGAGNKVLDVATGTGEPALMLARRTRGNADIVGVDASEGMIAAARAKVEKENLSNVQFDVMPAEKLSFDNHSFHRIMCRFGVMLFDNPARGLSEMSRVLKVGGRLVVVVWSQADRMPSMRWSYEAFKDRLPEEKHPPLVRGTSLGDPDVLEKLLQDSGLHSVRVMTKQFNYSFDSFESYWELVDATGILKAQFDALPENQHAQIKNEIRQMAEEFMSADGLVVPHEYLIASGVK
ncbi:MAG: class I SAM-dependent methyltransferase [Gammaproteobacteria bacterium]|nr:class I SAM-dependent methyltransferase [Gammaproteobacteria bacterium]